MLQVMTEYGWRPKRITCSQPLVFGWLVPFEGQPECAAYTAVRFV